MTTRSSGRGPRKRASLAADLVLGGQWGCQGACMLVVECPQCKARVEAEAVADISAPIREPEVRDAYEMSYLNVYDGEPPHAPDPSWRYRLLRCRACGDPLLVRQYDFDDGPADRLWPPLRHRLWGLQPPVQIAVDEAVRCLGAGAYVATAMMCRRALEALCRQYYPDIRNLAWALTQLRSDGIIDAQLAEWASALRESGNLAAHESDADISEEDAEDLLDFTEAILGYVVVLREQFQLFRARRSSHDQGAGH